MALSRIGTDIGSVLPSQLGGTAQARTVRCSISGNAGIVSLHRPGTLNALDHDMILDLTSALMTWRRASEIQAVILDLAGGASDIYSGSDLTLLARRSSWDIRGSREFFAAQYRLIDLIRSYPKPVFSFMSGTFIGFAASLAAAGHLRFASPDTVVRFPETGIGLAPDGASTWYLSRLKQNAGFWLALTGSDIAGADLEWCGLVTRTIPTTQLRAIRQGVIDTGPVSLSTSLKAGRKRSTRLPADEIAAAFSRNSVEDILSALQEGSDWAQAQARLVLEKSPLASRIVLRQLKTGMILSNAREALRLEYRILSRLVCSQDFREGYRSRLTDRGSVPNWQPRKLSRVTANTIAKYFSPPRDGELDFISDGPGKE